MPRGAAAAAARRSARLTRKKAAGGDPGQTRAGPKQQRGLRKKPVGTAGTGTRDANAALVGSASAQLPGVRMLLDEAQEQLELMNVDSALEKLAEAYSRAPNDVEVLDAYGAVLAEAGQAEEAANVLQKAIEIMPEVGWEKYMCLGQLVSGSDGVKLVRKGVQMLFEEWQQNLKSKAIVKTDPEELKAQLGRALCCLGEMLLSKLLAPYLPVEVNGLNQYVILLQVRLTVRRRSLRS